MGVNMLRSKKIIKAILFCASVLSAVSLYHCNKNSNPSGPSEQSHNWPSDTLVYDVVYNPSAKIISRADVKGSIDSAGSDMSNGMYHFVDAPESIKSLESGQTVLLECLDLIRVASVETSGNSVTLHYIPDTITNLIKDGTIIYRGVVNMDTTGGLCKIAASNPGDDSNEPVFKPQKSITFSGLFPGSVEVNYSIAKGEGKTVFEGDAKISADPGVKVSIAAKGSVKEFHCEYRCYIADRKITYRKAILRDVDAELTLSLGGVQTGKKDQNLKMPKMVKFPLPTGVLPVWIGIGWGLEFSSTLTDQSSALGKATFTLKGSLGYYETPGVCKLLGEGFSVDSKLSGSEMVSTTTAGFGVLLEFPKVGFGIGESLLEASVYASMKNEVVLNFVPFYDYKTPFPVITSQCFTGNINTGFYVGVGAKILGVLELNTEQQLYASTKQAFKQGDACE
jgi:hypothetical protein